MTTLDDWLAQLGSGWLFVLVLAAVLGLRHASDPDHLTALLTLRLKERQRSPHLLGLAWGTGHALTMVLIGVPLILLLATLPAIVQQGLELAVGLIIIILALRVLLGIAALRAHTHSHVHPDGSVHVHPHTHGTGSHAHGARSTRSAFGIGLLHGAGGSAGVTALILARLEDPAQACLALAVIAVFCAAAMVGCSWLLCKALDRGERRPGASRIAIIGGVSALGFGVWYAAAAFELLPYPA